jgi:ABC-type transport system involved in multi-copper enzyme maturation permease subunit
MLAVVRSELTRLRQPRLLVIWFGLMALFAAMVNTIMVTFVSGGGSMPPGAPGVAFPTLAEMESPSGLMAGLAAASNMFGIVTLSFWALATATDYGSGLIRLLVAAEPRRWRLLVGKVGALLVVTAAATTVAAAVNVVAVMPAAVAAGISTDAWGTDLVTVVVGAWLDLFLALCVWGVLGLVIAVLTRSAAVAIAIGAGYVLVVESILKMLEDVPSDWLLGTTLNAVASGGTPAVGFGTALALAAGYVIVGLVVAGLVYVRRDVTD